MDFLALLYIFGIGPLQIASGIVNEYCQSRDAKRLSASLGYIPGPTSCLNWNHRPLGILCSSADYQLAHHHESVRAITRGQEIAKIRCSPATSIPAVYGAKRDNPQLSYTATSA